MTLRMRIPRIKNPSATGIGNTRSQPPAQPARENARHPPRRRVEKMKGERRP